MNIEQLLKQSIKAREWGVLSDGCTPYYLWERIDGVIYLSAHDSESLKRLEKVHGLPRVG